MTSTLWRVRICPCFGIGRGLDECMLTDRADCVIHLGVQGPSIDATVLPLLVQLVAR
jgi:hypothetical protein